MEQKINIAELLKDCPKGMELDCTMYENVTFEEVVGTIDCDGNEDINIILLTHYNDGTDDAITLTNYGTYTYNETAKCVIFPKGKTTWEGFQRPFKDGDVVFYSNTIAIFKEWGDETLFRTYCGVYQTTSNHEYQFEISRTLFGKGIRKEARFATEEEKQKLFKVIKENGYRWVAETKTLVEPTFNDGDILATDLGSVFFLNTRLNSDERYGCYVGKGGDGSFHICEPFAYKECCGLATEKEKQKLFDAIKANGYKWNPETKTLEKLITPNFNVGDVIQDKCSYKVKIAEVNIEDECYVYESMIAKGIGGIAFSKQDDWELVPNKFDITTLKPFESRVLMRDKNTEKWVAQFFSHYNNGSDRPYTCIGCEGLNEYIQCIPYEGNEHLLDTTNDCDEYYKTW